MIIVRGVICNRLMVTNELCLLILWYYSCACLQLHPCNANLDDLAGWECIQFIYILFFLKNPENERCIIY